MVREKILSGKLFIANFKFGAISVFTAQLHALCRLLLRIFLNHYKHFCVDIYCILIELTDRTYV